VRKNFFDVSYASVVVAFFYPKNSQQLTIDVIRSTIDIMSIRRKSGFALKEGEKRFPVRVSTYALPDLCETHFWKSKNSKEGETRLLESES
jgi:hypothetical protein